MRIVLSRLPEDAPSQGSLILADARVNPLHAMNFVDDTI